ncbi:MAG: hypothetical protein VW257_09115, partial [Quisquiliibacterium sp.]
PVGAPTIDGGPTGSRPSVLHSAADATWPALSARLELSAVNRPNTQACWVRSGELWLLQWPAEKVFDRRALFAAFGRGSTLRIEYALFRTARDWYQWSAQADPRWRPTGWRLDSRIAVLDASPAELSDLRSRLEGCIEDPS